MKPLTVELPTVYSPTAILSAEHIMKPLTVELPPVYSPTAILSAVHIMKPLTVELPPVYISAVPTNPLYLPHYPNLNTFTLRSSRSLKGPYKTTGNVVILHILMHFQFL